MMLRLTFFLISFFCVIHSHAKKSDSNNMGVYAVNSSYHFEGKIINFGIESELIASTVNPDVSSQENVYASNQQFDFSGANYTQSISKKEVSETPWTTYFRYSFIFFSIVFSCYLALKIS